MEEMELTDKKAVILSNAKEGRLLWSTFKAIHNNAGLA